jgi:hypothetical protein
MPESVYDIIIFVLKALFYGQFAVYFLIVCPWLFERFRWFRIVNMVQVGVLSGHLMINISFFISLVISRFIVIEFLSAIVSIISIILLFAIVYFVSWKFFCFIMEVLNIINESLFFDRAEKKAAKRSEKNAAKELSVPREDIKPVPFWIILSLELVAAGVLTVLIFV